MVKVPYLAMFERVERHNCWCKQRRSLTLLSVLVIKFRQIDDSQTVSGLLGNVNTVFYQYRALRRLIRIVKRVATTSVFPSSPDSPNSFRNASQI